MTPLQARLLLVLSALLHATWNAVLRREAKARPHGQAGAVVLVTGFVACALALCVLDVQVALTRQQAGWAFLAGLAEALYFATLGPALAALPLGQAYAYVRGGGMLLVWGTSTAFLGEPASFLATGGSALLFLGLVWPDARAPHRLQLPPASVVGCALGVTGYHLAYAQGLRAGAGALPLLAFSMLVALPALLLPLGRAGWARAGASFRAAPWALTSAGALSALAFVLFLASLRYLDAGSGFALRNSSIVFAQLLGWLGGERVTRRSLGVTALVLAGACAVAAA